MTPEPMRLQRFLARAGVCSRRAAEQLIEQRRVRVNGQVVDQQGVKVDPRLDRVELDGRAVSLPENQETVTIMLNKPAGYLSSMADPHAKRLVSQLVPLREHPGLFPVGRLDLDTTGLLLFTDDGELGNALAHPSHSVDKAYLATVEGVPDRRALAALEDGVELEDGLTAPAVARVVEADRSRGTSVVRLVLHEGRKRQVKRMCQAVGHPVLALHRAAVGPLALGSLRPGAWRALSPDELAALRQAAGLDA